MRRREGRTAEEIALRRFRSCVHRARHVRPQIWAAAARYRNPDSLYRRNRQLAYWIELKSEARTLADIIRAIRQERDA